MNLTVAPKCWFCGDEDGPFAIAEFANHSFVYCERCLSGDAS